MGVGSSTGVGMTTGELVDSWVGIITNLEVFFATNHGCGGDA